MLVVPVSWFLHGTKREQASPDGSEWPERSMGPSRGHGRETPEQTGNLIDGGESQEDRGTERECVKAVERDRWVEDGEARTTRKGKTRLCVDERGRKANRLKGANMRKD